jgi:hypothetical protein
VKFVLILLLSLMAFEAESKNVARRLGVGFKDQFSESLPSVAAQYYPYDDLGFSAALGVDTRTDNSGFGLMVKLYRILPNMTEEHMNFYMGAGAGLLSKETSGQTASGFELTGFVGGEFFIMGLDSLGFSFEAGIGITSISNGVRFRTFGDSPLRAGMIFYF